MGGNRIEDGIPSSDPTILYWVEPGAVCTKCGIAVAEGMSKIEKALIELNGTPEAQAAYIAREREPMQAKVKELGDVCLECRTTRK